jgi:small-conductance mechanosensitive channel
VLIRLSRLAGTLLEAYLANQTSDPALQRSIRTQVLVPLRVFRFLIVILAIALVLIQFELVRTVGLSMLASAGVAGVVIGLAAQRTVANLLAGIQLAVFQPIRIGDAVVVEGDYGTVEEIGLTYVVIKIWDERRLILPVSYFLEKPFQNWTRQSAEMLGTVLLLTDYTVSVEEVRAELSRLLQETALWDRRVSIVQVTNFTEQSVELRILVSAADSAQLFELRCLVREKLLVWLQTSGQSSLPRRRVESRTITTS